MATNFTKNGIFGTKKNAKGKNGRIEKEKKIFEEFENWETN